MAILVYLQFLIQCQSRDNKDRRSSPTDNSMYDTYNLPSSKGEIKRTPSSETLLFASGRTTLSSLLSRPL